LAKFEWLGALAALAAMLIVTLIAEARSQGEFGWGEFTFISLPCMVAAVRVVKVGVCVGLGALLAYGIVGFIRMQS
jgi:hypothetical protein